MTTTDQLPNLPGKIDGIVGQWPWQVQCRDCGLISEHHMSLLQAVKQERLLFHPWPDGTNPRLCGPCRLARDCHCHRCDEERIEARR